MEQPHVSALVAQRYRTEAHIKPSPEVPLTFQLMDIYEGVSQAWNPQKNKQALKPNPTPIHAELCTDAFFSAMDHLEEEPEYKKPAYDDEKCLLLLFGCDAMGRSICVQVRYFPYFLVEVPETWGDTLTDYQCNEFCRALARERVYKVNYEIIEAHHLSGWQSDSQDPTKRRLNRYLRLRFSSVKHMESCAYALKKPLYVAGTADKTPRIFKIWEHGNGIKMATRYLVENHLIAGGWVTLAPGQFQDPALGYVSTCQVEVAAKSMVSVKPVPENVTMAPLLIVSVDGEMTSERHRFPDAANAKDYVIGIGVSVARYNEKPEEADGYYFGLRKPGNTDSPPPPWQVSPKLTFLSFSSEVDLLEAYRDFLVCLDPDIVIGYNTHRFDWHYFSQRAPAHSRFFRQSRVAARHTPLEEEKMQSAAFGQNHEYFIRMYGRLEIDMMVNIKRNSTFKLRKYGLSDVSKKFLKDTKVDLPYEQMMKNWDSGGVQENLEIAQYCIQDTLLPMRLLHAVLTVPNIVEMGRVTSTFPQEIVDRGQTQKITNFFFREAIENHFVFTVFDDTSVPGYVGATVIPPVVGFYEDPIVTLDFSSLYPSILIDKNLSHDTFVLPGGSRLPSQVLTNPETQDTFVTHVEGLLPQMEKKLLKDRKAVKKQMKAMAKSEALYPMLDAKQLAIKTVCNSIYGYCGAPTNRYNCPSVARTITYYGRQMLQQTKRLVESSFPGSQIIYGDTDSVFVRFAGISTLAEAFDLGTKAAALATKHFGGNAIELAMEKVMQPLLLMAAKKRYTGIKFESVTDPGEMYSRGLETVRRDVSPFAAETYAKVLDALIGKKNVLLAQKELFQQLCDLEDGKIPLEKFEVSVQMKSVYKNTNLPQLTVVRKMRERNPGSEPTPGDRFGYTIIDIGDPAAKVSDKAEDVAYVRAHNLPVDYLHFLRLLETAVSKLFVAFTDDPSILFRRTQSVMLNRASGAQDLRAMFGKPAPREMPRLPPKTVSKLALLMENQPRQDIRHLFQSPSSAPASASASSFLPLPPAAKKAKTSKTTKPAGLPKATPALSNFLFAKKKN